MPGLSRDPKPYLEGVVRGDFDAWIENTVARFSPPLTFREVRKGVQALSSLYVERRKGDLSTRALDGSAKRAALASYYAPLHFLSLWHLMGDWQPHFATPVGRIIDLGCGSGAAGAALARVLPNSPPVVGIDRSGFLLREARHTYRSFGVPASTRRGKIPAALPKPRAGDLWLFAFSLNEFSDADREITRDAIIRAIDADVSLFIIEPLAGPTTPWWKTWRDAFTPFSMHCDTWKHPRARPEWIGRLDRAASLDHRVLGARAIVGPVL